MDESSVRRELFRGLAEAGRSKLPAFERECVFGRYRNRPQEFAAKVLGSRWWAGQEEVGKAVAAGRRVAVKSGNGVGKTHLAADLALWFLYTHRPAIVLVTAPTWRQAKEVLWAEIARRWAGTRGRQTLPGRMLQTKLDVGHGSFALALTADRADAFQGFHCPNLLVILDEASGVAPVIWEAADGVAVSENNKILAIGNPLSVSGRFYETFRKAGGWRRITINALLHPNVTGVGREIAGCVTRGILGERVAEWCEAAVSSQQSAVSGDQFVWEGRVWEPTDVFRTRVLGEFPRAEEYGLIPLAWIEAAVGRTLEAMGVRRLAADVARFGADWTVIGMRVGPVMTGLLPLKGADTMQVAGEIERLAYAERSESVGVDSVGIGAGVVDRLVEREIQGVEAVNGSSSARDGERYANRRAELYWGLRERLRKGEIAIMDDAGLVEELASIRYKVNSRGQIQIEGKEEMKGRLGRSPDRADMLAMLFDSSWDVLGMAGEREVGPSRAAVLRGEMDGW